MTDPAGVWQAGGKTLSEKVADIIAEHDALRAALENVELRVTQAIIASGIGSKKDRTDFLRGELTRIAEHTRAALSKGQP